MVCSHHHRLLHDDGWAVALHRDGTTAWTRPGGVPFVPGPLTRLRELKRHLARRNDPANHHHPSRRASGRAPATGDPPGTAAPPTGDPPSSSDPPADTATG